MDHKIVCSSLIYFDVAEHETTENAYNKQDPRREPVPAQMAAQREAHHSHHLSAPACCPCPLPWACPLLGAAPSAEG